MKIYEFPYSCDVCHDTIRVSISEKEAELIKEAYRDAFTSLEDTYSLEDLRERIVNCLDFYEPDAEQDIRIYFPVELKKEVDNE